MDFTTLQNYHPSVKKSNRAKFLSGPEKTAVILLHGFASSPFEVFSLGKEINAAGFPVFMPLVAGFGGNTALANQMSYQDWQRTLTESIDQTRSQYKKIIIAGFSLGGALVSDFLTERNSNKQNIVAAILLAPYYKPKIWAAKSGSYLLHFFVEKISFSHLYKISKNKDIEIPLAHPNHYNTDLPIKAVKEIVRFGEKIRQKPNPQKVQLPTLLVYSEDDQTVSNRETIRFTTENFARLKTLIFAKHQKIRHQLAIPEGNGEFDTLVTAVNTFIQDVS